MGLPRRVLPTLLLGIALTAQGAAGADWLVRDLRTTPAPTASSSPKDFTQAGPLAFFFATDRVAGYEPWRTDGTTDGTFRLTDVRPGASGSVGSSGTRIVARGATVFFAADDGTAGQEPWTSDGTPEGTRLVADVNPGAAGSQPQELTVVDDLLFFVADDGASGAELWRTDGTPEGTSLVADVRPGSASSSPHALTACNGLLFFLADDGTSGTELWRSDGTTSGTRRVVDLAPGPASGAWSLGAGLVNAGDVVIFAGTDGTSGTEPWRSDGTAAGTWLVADVVPGGAGSFPGSFVATTGGIVYFLADDSAHGREPWRTDGTAAGTWMVVDVRPGSTGSDVVRLGVLGEGVVFAADDGAHGREPWASDGTPAGTRMLRDVRAGSASGAPDTFAAVTFGSPPRAAFATDDGTAGLEPWITDGTPAGTQALLDVRPGSDASVSWVETPTWGAFGGKLLLGLDDGATGNEAWLTDGTPAGTRLVKDIEAGSDSNPQELVAFGSRLAFTADDGETGREPWITDGTEDGTLSLGDLAPGAASSTPRNLVVAGGAMYFTADDGVLGREPWISDGTAAGTHVLRDVASGVAASAPTSLTAFAGGIAFVADDADGGHGAEPWISDGTEGGTRLLADVRVGAASSAPRELTAVGNELFFIADDGTSGAELWAADATGVASLVADLTPGAAATPARGLAAAGSVLVFQVDDTTQGTQLWRSDGTEPGTRMLVQVGRPGSTFPLYLTSIGDRAVFFGGSDSASTEPWVTDGTQAGTMMLRDVFPGAGGCVPTFFQPQLVASGGRAWFVADDSTHGMEPWTTDGTSGGTVLLADVATGTASSFPERLVPLGARLTFAARTVAGGARQLWASDGTADGTFVLARREPSSRGAAAGGLVFFPALTAETGRELWAAAVDRDADGFRESDDCNDRDAGERFVPDETTGLRITRQGAALHATWDDVSADAGARLRHQLVTGTLPIDARAPLADATCVGSNLTAAEASVLLPASGWLLVRSGFDAPSPCGWSDWGSPSVPPTACP